MWKSEEINNISSSPCPTKQFSNWDNRYEIKKEADRHQLLKCE